MGPWYRGVSSHFNSKRKSKKTCVCCRVIHSVNSRSVISKLLILNCFHKKHRSLHLNTNSSQVEYAGCYNLIGTLFGVFLVITVFCKNNQQCRCVVRKLMWLCFVILQNRRQIYDIPKHNIHNLLSATKRYIYLHYIYLHLWQIGYRPKNTQKQNKQKTVNLYYSLY